MRPALMTAPKVNPITFGFTPLQLWNSLGLEVLAPSHSPPPPPLPLFISSVLRSFSSVSLSIVEILGAPVRNVVVGRGSHPTDGASRFSRPTGIKSTHRGPWARRSPVPVGGRPSAWAWNGVETRGRARVPSPAASRAMSDPEQPLSPPGPDDHRYVHCHLV